MFLNASLTLFPSFIIILKNYLPPSNISHASLGQKPPYKARQSCSDSLCGIHRSAEQRFSNRTYILNMQHEITAKNTYSPKTNKQNKLLNQTWLDVSNISVNFSWICLHWFCCLNSSRCQKFKNTYLGKMDNSGQFIQKLSFLCELGKDHFYSWSLGQGRTTSVEETSLRTTAPRELQKLGRRYSSGCGASLQGKFLHRGHAVWGSNDTTAKGRATKGGCLSRFIQCWQLRTPSGIAWEIRCFHSILYSLILLKPFLTHQGKTVNQSDATTKYSLKSWKSSQVLMSTTYLNPLEWGHRSVSLVQGALSFRVSGKAHNVPLFQFRPQRHCCCYIWISLQRLLLG